MAEASLNDLLQIATGNPWHRHFPESGSISNDLLGPGASPSSIRLAYRTGAIRGVIVDDPQVPWYARAAARYTRDALAAARDYPLIWEDTSQYRAVSGRGAAQGRVYGWKPWLQVDPQKGLKSRQLTGDCVSHGIRGARDRLRAIRILMGAQEAYVERQATCGIYSGRGHTGQGADPGGLSQYAVKIGTLLEKQYLDGKYDFRNYDDYVKWGMQRGRVGMPEDLLAETKQHTDEKTFLVTTWDGFIDALSAGYTAHAGSMLGVSNVGDPISRESGSWSHDMDIPGYDVSREYVNEDVVIWDQSWGNWNRVTNIPEAWKPWGEGMFATTRQLFERRVLAARGTWVFVPGEYFPAEPINNLLI